MKNLNILLEMKDTRKLIITMSLIIALAACLLPPWQVYWIGNFVDPPMLMELEYGFLFACPKEHEIFKCFIDWYRLITELLAIGFLTGIGIVLTKGKVKL